VAHAMVFTKDSIFLNLVRGEREHKNYGITHTMPYKLVEEKDKKNLLKIYKLECRCCGNKSLKRVISLGFQPLANNLILNIKNKVEKYPLEMNYCPKCHNTQLSVAVNAKEMFNNYLYLSSTSQSFRSHFEKAANKYFKEFKLKKNSYVIDIGSNDGIALTPFKNLGLKNILGVEPAKNLCKISIKNGIKTYNGFLDQKALKKIKRNANLVLASNVFAHSDNLKMMGECMLKLVSKKGTIIIEVQYLVNMLKDLTFDNIYHEHYNYWSLTSLVYFFNKLNAKIFKVEKVKTHGGSLRIYITRDFNKKSDLSVQKILNEEENFGIKKFSTYQKFSKKILKLKENVISNIVKLKNGSKKIIGYGSPAKATTALNYYGISKEIDFIVEDNKLKHGKIIPGVNIPICSKEKVKDKNSTIIVFAWNFFNSIKKNNSNLSNKFVNIKSLEKNEIN
tara:strand:- start:179 stop:1525 length:1347 start_codon:yes stop_codon:yes gene_type:complete